jgi:type VI secretion system secreted protein VgrG
VFLDKTVPEIIEACLKDGGLTAMDFEFRLQKTYDPREYVCQYGESHLNFISRWSEREGIYYFFEQQDGREKVIFADTKIVHTPLSQGSTLNYQTPSGLDHSRETEILRTFSRRCHLVPAAVLLKDYNYLRPSLEVSGSAEVDKSGRGQYYHYGDHFLTPEAGARLAAIQAEALRCRQQIFRGESSVPYLAPGFTFDLKDHFQEQLNQGYLIIEVSHEGSQTGYLVTTLKAGLEGENHQVFYRNSFTAIPAAVQFRPEGRAEKPRISGTISAKIDTAGTGQYAEIDEHGRYKVILPFDISGRKDGAASARIRMAQPYGGSNHGMHFPLHKGTEVLLTFLDGDPDRPIITGAVPNPETPSPVTGANQTQAIIKTGSQNKIAIEDAEGKEQIHMQTPNKGSFITVGAPSDKKTSLNPPDPEKLAEFIAKLEELAEKIKEKNEDTWGIELFTNKLLSISAEMSNKIILGEETTVIGGASTELVLGMEWKTIILLYLHWVFGGIVEVHMPEKATIENFHIGAAVDHMEAKVKHLEAVAATKTELADEIRSVGRRQYDLLMTRLQAVDRKINAVHEEVGAVDRKVNLTNDDVRAVNTTLGAHTSSINACADEIKSMGTALEDTGMAIATIGAVVQDSGTAVSSLGTDIKDTGMSINSAGMHATDAPLIMHN